MGNILLALNLQEQVKEGTIEFDAAVDTLAKQLPGRDELTRTQIASELLRT